MLEAPDPRIRGLRCYWAAALVKVAGLRITAVAVLVASTATLALGGCGGEEDDHLTAEEYLDQTREICREARTGLQELDPDDFHTYIQRGAEILRAEVDALEALEPPEEQEDLRPYVTALGRVADVADDAAELAADGDETAAKARFDEAGKLAEDARKVAEDVGLTSCAA